jgi:hypothetical protein
MGCSNDYSIEVEKDRTKQRSPDSDSSFEENIPDLEECESK